MYMQHTMPGFPYFLNLFVVQIYIMDNKIQNVSKLKSGRMLWSGSYQLAVLELYLSSIHFSPFPPAFGFFSLFTQFLPSPFLTPNIFYSPSSSAPSGTLQLFQVEWACHVRSLSSFLNPICFAFCRSELLLFVLAETRSSDSFYHIHTDRLTIRDSVDTFLK